MSDDPTPTPKPTPPPRPPRPPVELAPDGTGSGLVRLALAGTALHAVAAGLAVAFDGLRAPHTVLCVLEFVAGIGAMALAFVRGADRTRTELVTVGGWFLLLGAAPRRTLAAFYAAVGVQLAVGFGAAAARPYTSLAFSTLAFLWSFGLMGLWGGTYGAFPRRPDR